LIGDPGAGSFRDYGSISSRFTLLQTEDLPDDSSSSVYLGGRAALSAAVSTSELTLALLDPQVAREPEVVAAYLFHEALGVLAADECVGRVTTSQPCSD
jgi:hypothetical protein